MKVKRSLFSRILKLFIGMSIATLVLTTLIYIPLGRNYVQALKIKEVQPVIDSMEKIMQDYSAGLIDERSFERVMVAQTIANNAQLVIADAQGKVIFATRAIKDDRHEFDSPDEFDLNSTGLMSEILNSSATTSTTTTLPGSDFESIVIGKPIVLNATTVGALALILPVFEITRSVNTLVLSLVISMSVILLGMTFVLYLFSKRLTQPLHQMMQVANDMTQGDFSLKADELDQSEIGALGSSLNRMSSALKTTMDEINLERARLNWMLNSMKEGVISMDGQGQITLTNPAFETLLEIESPDDITAILAIESVKKTFDQGRQGEFSTTLFEHRSHIIGLSVSPILTIEGQLDGCVGLFVDRSESERLEKMRRDYVANVSHELRTPLTAIRAILDPLNDDLIKDEARKHDYYRSMLKETERLNRLINDLLELSRLQSSNESFKTGQVDLGLVLQDLVDKFAPMAQQKSIHLELELPSQPCLFTTSEDRLEQVLTILVDNAFKFTPDNGSVKLALDLQEARPILKIQDTGHGISPTDLPYIFERFYTADKARTQKSFGLGLSIAKEICDRLHVRIEVQSKLEQGTCFTLRF